jgi:hypothetical protein
MKIKTDTPIKNLAGQVMKDNDGQGNSMDASVRTVVVNALLAPLQQGKNEQGVDKVKKYELAKKIFSDDEVELTVEEVALIKSRVGETFPPLVVGQVYEMLEGKTGDS